MKSKSYADPRVVIFTSYPYYFLCLLREPLNVAFFFLPSRLTLPAQTKF